MKVLVTGTEGYIGSVLTPWLLSEKHEIVAVDTGFFRDGWLYHHAEELPQTRLIDIRHLTPKDLEGFDAVVHMAELANDPLGELAPEITYDINHIGSLKLAQMAKAAGVKRFVYTSSCSAYGIAENGMVSETSAVNPQTAYAHCKVKVEKDLAAMADDDFSPTFLRNATVYGASPRLRFDLVVNNLCGVAFTKKAIVMTSDGTPWRPLVHVDDVCRAICQVLTAKREVVHNQILNVGNSDSNYQVREIAEIVAKVFPGCALQFGQNNSDNRSYRVSFDKITSILPDFQCQWSVERGARQLKELFDLVDLKPEDFHSRRYTRLLQLQHLIGTNQIDSRFFWTKKQLLEPKGERDGFKLSVS
jgi:nucleoside-diphosphate-sugar epimerase